MKNKRLQGNTQTSLANRFRVVPFAVVHLDFPKFYDTFQTTTVGFTAQNVILINHCVSLYRVLRERLPPLHAVF